MPEKNDTILQSYTKSLLTEADVYAANKKFDKTYNILNRVFAMYTRNKRDNNISKAVTVAAEETGEKLMEDLITYIGYTEDSEGDIINLGIAKAKDEAAARKLFIQYFELEKGSLLNVFTFDSVASEDNVWVLFS